MAFVETTAPLRSLAISLALHGAALAGIAWWGWHWQAAPRGEPVLIEVELPSAQGLVASPELVEAPELLPEPESTSWMELDPVVMPPEDPPALDDPRPGSAIRPSVQRMSFRRQAPLPQEVKRRFRLPSVPLTLASPQEEVVAQSPPVLDKQAGEREDVKEERISAMPLAGACPTPPYPRAAIRRHLEGAIFVRVWVSDAGEVLRVALDQGCSYSILNEAALRAVRNWRFEPARENGKAVADEIVVRVRFQLEGQS
ncbi:MAG: energy transducer TonB [Planctomycetota bacterium]|nr:MAG: energy transducer TonB [Planctomycetota bacterium]